MTDWVPGDWGTIKLDAVVKIEHADGSEVHGKIGHGLGGKVLVSKFGVRDLDTLKFDDWNLFVPKPTQPELPTETGAYFDKYGSDVWTITAAHGLQCVTSISSRPEKYAPFTRLLPEAETAKRIAIELRNRANGFAGGCHTVAPIGNAAVEKAVDWIVAEFGVSLD